MRFQGIGSHFICGQPCSPYTSWQHDRVWLNYALTGSFPCRTTTGTEKNFPARFPLFRQVRRMPPVLKYVQEVSGSVHSPALLIPLRKGILHF